MSLSQSVDRAQAADWVAARISTSSVEDRCESLAHSRALGWNVALAGMEMRERRAMLKLYEWMMENGWAGGETPDIESLLVE